MKDDGKTEFDRQLEEMIKKEEREKAQVLGRKAYDRKPTSYYASLAVEHEVATNRVRSRSRSPLRLERERRERRERGRSSTPPDKKAKLVSREHLEKMRRLKQRYGDASAGEKKKKT